MLGSRDGMLECCSVDALLGTLTGILDGALQDASEGVLEW